MLHEEFMSLKETGQKGSFLLPFVVSRTVLPDFYTTFPMHWHNEMEIVYVEEGEFEECINFEYYHVRKGDIVIVNPAMIDTKKRGELDDLAQRLPNVAFAALVYQYIEPDVLRYFKTTIDISDSRERVAVKLRQMLETAEPATESTELSDREKEILVAVAKGMTNKSIAEQYHLSVHTVITHRKNLTRKTGIKSVSGLTVYAILNNLIDITEVE